MRRRAGPSRRRFLQWGVALAAGAITLPRPPLRLAAAALPTPVARHYFSDPDALAAAAGRFDAVLLPAYAAASLIQSARALAQWPRAPGRAHDPAGAFTAPLLVAAVAVRYRGAPPEASTLDDVFQPGALWPAFGRLAFGVALLRRGWLPDETHPGRLAQAARDLSAARPRFVADPARALAAGQGETALALVDLAAPPPDARFPAGARLALEFDWVIPRASPRAAEAEAFLAAQPAEGAPWPSRAYTLSPLPPRARARQAALWAELLRADPAKSASSAARGPAAGLN